MTEMKAYEISRKINTKGSKTRRPLYEISMQHGFNQISLNVYGQIWMQVIDMIEKRVSQRIYEDEELSKS